MKKIKQVTAIKKSDVVIIYDPSVAKLMEMQWHSPKLGLANKMLANIKLPEDLAEETRQAK